MQTLVGSETPSRLPSMVQAKRARGVSSTGDGDFLGRHVGIVTAARIF